MHRIKNTGHLLLVGAGLTFGPTFDTTTSWFVTLATFTAALIAGVTLAWPLRWVKLTPSGPVTAEATRIQLTVARSGGLWLGSVGEVTQWRRRQVTVTVLPLKRGLASELPGSLVARDWFGWFEKRGGLRLSQPLVILPHPRTELAQQVRRMLPPLARLQPAQVGEFQGLRAYQPGDSVQLIDWKKTAQRALPVVRQVGVLADTAPAAVLLAERPEAFELSLSVLATLSAGHQFRQSLVMIDQQWRTLPSGSALAALEAPRSWPPPPPSVSAVVAFVDADTQAERVTQWAAHRPVVLVRLSREQVVVEGSGQKQVKVRRGNG